MGRGSGWRRRRSRAVAGPVPAGNRVGSGGGLALVDDDTSGTAVAVSTIVWVTVVQLAASVLGGYLAGRLRSRWVTVHSNEVFFRDTAHGFLAWAVSTLLMATLLSSALGAMVSTGAKAVGTVAGAAVTASAGAATAVASTEEESAGANPMGYFVDSLFRQAPGATGAAAAGNTQTAPDRTAEVTRIFASALKDGRTRHRRIRSISANWSRKEPACRNPTRNGA